MSLLYFNEQRFGLNRPDGETVAAYRWSSPASNAKMVVVVAHGMGEHARRYPPALSHLLANQIDIYGLDHRGHGASIGLSKYGIGDFGPGGFNSVVEDLHALVVLARQENVGIPLVLLGHSMGSFIAQAYIQSYSDTIDAVVLVGTTAVETLIEGLKDETDVMQAFNRPFEPSRTPCDWLSTDPNEVDLYVNDPLCGFSLNDESMTSLFTSAPLLADGERNQNIPNQLPMYVLVGGMDPLSTSCGSLMPLINRFESQGLSPKVEVYPHGRHEILNESNRAEVVENLYMWLCQAVL